LPRIAIGKYPAIHCWPRSHREWWSKIGWKLDHAQFVDLLETVRKMRNELMHFAPDPVAEEKFAAVTRLLELLRAADPHP
jgi:restriction system protein